MERSLIFWMWNDRIEPGEIRRQIAGFHRRHIGGFFVHAMPEEFRPEDFPGGMPGYLSEYFFDMVRIAAECAAELGMELWLYDEGGWPSGTMNGRMPGEDPELAISHIYPDGSISPLPNRPDLLNPEVTGRFISAVHEKYAKRLQPFFGKVIPGIFTDEPFFGYFEPETRLPWSPVLAGRFQEVKGYPLKECAEKIFRGVRQARADYSEVWCSLIAENYLRPIQQWCHARHLLCTGHFNGDDCPENAFRLLGGDIFRLHQYFDIPGCDAIWRQIHPLTPESDFSRLTAAAAGAKPCLSESFAVYGADLAPAEMKQIAAMQFVSGVTIVAPMALHYSERGSRQITTCAGLYPGDSRWENYAQISDYLRRMSKVFDRTTPVIKASVPCPLREMREGTADMGLFQQGLKLAAQQITYDYSPDAAVIPAVPAPDLQLETPCPELRTRHLRSPRGERRILVNAGLTPLKCRFTAPAGFNSWYDPATGRRSPAAADAAGMLTLELPFSGVMVLLTLPGRSRPPLPPEKPAAVQELQFRETAVLKAFRAGENALTEVLPPPVKLAADQCGTVRLTARVRRERAAAAMVELPAARRMVCKLAINGRALETRLWGPYRWELELTPGENLLTLDVTGTPAAAMYAPAHLEWLKSRGYLNEYLQKCVDYTPLFPDEQPAAGALLKIREN